MQGVANLGLSDCVVPFPRRAPGGDDDLGRVQQGTELMDENGGDKLVHGSGGISQPRAE